MRYVLPLVLALLAGPMLAQTPSPDGKAPISNATVDELVNALKPSAPTRSLRLRNMMVEPAKVEPTNAEPTKLDLTINFEFGSARLQTDSRPLLEHLAAAMKTEQLTPLRFQIEGHTDAKGSVQYNDALSTKRAQAVMEFLATQGVATERLKAEGKGFRELLDSNDPLAARNRRVRITVLE